MAKKDATGTKGGEMNSEEISLVDVHPDHDHHLCHIVALRNLKTAGRLAKDAQYICYICGRAAKSNSNLCEPVKL